METVCVRKIDTGVMVNIEVLPIEQLDVRGITSGDKLNFVLRRSIEDWEGVALMFGPLHEGDRVILVAPGEWSWPTLLTFLGCFPSASRAARNLVVQGKSLEIKPGWHDFHIGRTRKIRIALWRPIFPGATTTSDRRG
jgi:hypothetical protein